MKHTVIHNHTSTHDDLRVGAQFSDKIDILLYIQHGPVPMYIHMACKAH